MTQPQAGPTPPPEAAGTDDILDAEVVETSADRAAQSANQVPAAPSDTDSPAAPPDPSPAATPGPTPASPTSGPPPVTPSAPKFDYTDAGVPTIDYVRDKIEGRYANALGATELAEDAQAGRDAAKQAEERERAAHDKLEEIRRSLHPEG